MRVVMFYHSLVSDWNHGNAHFLRGIATELIARGHDVVVYEPRGGWSRQNLEREHGKAAVDDFRRAFPHLLSLTYDLRTLNLDKALAGADLVMVHEWTDPELVHLLGQHRRARGGYRLLFHDTHHRAVSSPTDIAQLDLHSYDGVLAFGRVIGHRYRREGWARRVWTWHEAADARLFQPRRRTPLRGDLVWIGNWGDGERTAELEQFLLEPVRRLRLRADVYGVRYPEHALRALQKAGITYRGWLPNHRVPEVLAAYRATVHVPRDYYAKQLPGIPTIRVFEALACGIPLISAPWADSEGLFRPGTDYLTAADGDEMTRHLKQVFADRGLRRWLGANGRESVLDHHTCTHRVDELMHILRELHATDTGSAADAARTPASAAPVA